MCELFICRQQCWFSCQGSAAQEPGCDALDEILGAACGNQTSSEKENSGRFPCHWWCSLPMQIFSMAFCTTEPYKNISLMTSTILLLTSRLKTTPLGKQHVTLSMKGILLKSFLLHWVSVRLWILVQSASVRKKACKIIPRNNKYPRYEVKAALASTSLFAKW